MTMEQSTPGTAAAAVDDNRRRQQLRLRQRLKEMVTAAAAAAQTVYMRITTWKPGKTLLHWFQSYYISI